MYLHLALGAVAGDMFAMINCHIFHRIPNLAQQSCTLFVFIHFHIFGTVVGRAESCYKGARERGVHVCVFGRLCPTDSLADLLVFWVC